MRKLGFLERSFNKCEPAVKENLCNQLIRTKLEYYASTVWDPHNIGEQKIEKIQKRAYKSKNKSKSKNHLFYKTISIDTIHSLELYIVRRLILRNNKC